MCGGWWVTLEWLTKMERNEACVSFCGLSLTVVGCCGPALAFVGCCGHSVVSYISNKELIKKIKTYQGPNDVSHHLGPSLLASCALVNLHWSSLACIGPRQLSLAFVGCWSPSLAWVAVVGLGWLLLTGVGLYQPAKPSLTIVGLRDWRRWKEMSNTCTKIVHTFKPRMKK